MSDDREKKGLVEAAMWGGAGILLLALIGAFVLVGYVLTHPPETYEDRIVKPEAKMEEPKKPTPPPPPPKPVPKPGLVGRYYVLSGTVDDFRPLENLKPKLRRIEKTIDFPARSSNFGKTGLSSNFAVQWSGLIRIPKTGAYVFSTVSDDGSRLLIDGRKIVDNGGTHGMEEKKGRIDLKAGDHPLRIDFYQGGGDSGCQLLWEAKGMRKSVVPAEVLFHDE